MLLYVKLDMHHLVCAFMSWLFVYWILVSFLWVVPGDESKFEDPVENVYEEQSFDPTEAISGKMIIILDITTIFACYLSHCYRYVSLPTT
jgi:hypothetical protein